jgi:hypothetical protein
MSDALSLLDFHRSLGNTAFAGPPVNRGCGSACGRTRPKDLLGYYQRCVQSGQSAVNLGFIAG